MNNEIIDFLRRHNIKIIDDNKRFSKYRPQYLYWSSAEVKDLIRSEIVFETEKLYTIEIPESDLKKIQEFEDQVFGNLKEQGHYGLFQNLMEMKEEEKYLREKYPAVKKAYENYSLMLNLCKGGKLTEP